MRSKMLKKICAVLISASMFLPVISSVSMSVSAASIIESSWSVSTEEPEDVLPHMVNIAFNEAMERYQDGQLIPLSYYGVQVVSGYNYLMLCRNISDDNTVSLKEVCIYDPNYSTQRNRGKARFSSVTDFNLEDYAHDYKYHLPDKRIDGSMEISNSLYECELPDEVAAVYDEIFTDIVGVSCTPLAYLGYQNTYDGMNYALLCCQHAETYLPDRYIDVVILHKDINGDAYIKSSCSILGERINFPESLSNTSYLETGSTVTLGSKVVVKAQASGGAGDYEYKVMYRKSNSQTWHTKQDYSKNDTITITPGAATDYDVYVYVKDSEEKVVICGLYFSVYKELNNTTTISSESIKKGSSVTLNCSADGGAGSYRYAVYYKKNKATKWSTAQSYNANNVVTIKPGAAADYSVCVRVIDGNGKVSKKYFTVSVK